MKTYNAEDNSTTEKQHLDRQKICSTREIGKSKKVSRDPEASSRFSYIAPNTKAHSLQHPTSGPQTKQRLLPTLEDRPALFHWEVIRFDSSLEKSNAHKNHSNEVFASPPHPKEIPNQEPSSTENAMLAFSNGFPVYTYLFICTHTCIYKRFCDGDQPESAKSGLFLQKRSYNSQLSF